MMQLGGEYETGRPLSVLDIGTGSGILAIAAALGGAGKVVGIDTDPLACREAMANVEKNGVAEKILIVAGDISAVKGWRFDLVLANLRMPTLKGILPALIRMLTIKGIGIFSGFRPHEGRTLTNHLPGPGWEKIWEASNRGWMAVAMQRQPDDP